MRQSTPSGSYGDRPPPAQGDLRHQATGALRGFDYQLWQSVHLWTTLDSAQVLYLEAAEDVDCAALGVSKMHPETRHDEPERHRAAVEEIERLTDKIHTRYRALIQTGRKRLKSALRIPTTGG